MNGAAVSEGDARSRPREIIGRYLLDAAFASGGMASVHFGRLLGDVGFTRVVAIKRLHEHFARDADFAAMLLDEARLAANIHHPNVAGTLDVVATDDELFLVMEYVPGESLFTLLRAVASAEARMPPAHAVAIVVGALHGLHAAHEAKNAAGQRLGIVHRDVSPQNILVGEDGVARIIDFGIAKAVERVHSTRDGELRGKIGYMAPEQINRGSVDRRADVYAASVVLWEALTQTPYVEAASPAAQLKAALERRPEAPSILASDVPRGLDEVVLRGLSRQSSKRFDTALEMAAALEGAIQPSSQREVGAWVARTAAITLRQRAAALAALDGNADLVIPEDLPSAVRVFTTRTDAGPIEATKLPSPWLRRVALPVLLLALLAIVGLRVAVGGGSDAHSRAEPRQAAAPSVAPPLPPVAPPSAPSQEPTNGVTPDDTSTDVPVPTASASSASASAAPKTPARGAARRGCNPPYTIDSAGIRVPKLRCL